MKPRLKFFPRRSKGFPSGSSLGGEAGFIALTSAIIIFALLTTVAVALSSAAFMTRLNLLESEYKQRSASLADACVDIIMLKLAIDPVYAQQAGGEVFSVGSGSCKALSLSGGAQKTAKIQGEFQKAYTNLEVVIRPGKDSIVLDSWTEVARH